MASNVAVELHPEVVILTAQTHILLFQITNANLSRRERCDLLRGEVERCLELCNSLFKLRAVGEQEEGLDRRWVEDDTCSM